MLTAKENMRAAVFGGKPDRYVNQYEAISLLFHPYLLLSPRAEKGGPEVKDVWGVTYAYPDNVPASFPVHTPDKIVLKDIENWREYVHAPSLKDIPQGLWDACHAMWDAVDGNMAYKATFVAPGIFELSHHLSEMANAMIYYMENEDEMHDLVKYITDFEVELAESTCKNLHPDAVFHHDDWGSENNSFMRPEMFGDYFTEAYKAIYGCYKENGVEVVIHHSDSYCANLVPYMIEMGIDVWQGCMHTNNVPELVKKYQGKITFMGNIDNKFVDFEGWTNEDCVKAAVRGIEEVGSMTGYIPCITQGGPGSLYEGTYMGLSNAIDDYNSKHFGFTKEQLEAARLPISIMF